MRKVVVAFGTLAAITSGAALGAGLHNYPIGMLLGTSVGTATALAIGDQDAQSSDGAPAGKSEKRHR